MDTIAFNRTDINSMKKPLSEYRNSLSGTVDDFWEEHILTAELYTINFNDNIAGFFAIYDNEKITLFTVSKEYIRKAQRIFECILDKFGIKTAFVATCDELFLSLCLDNYKKIEMQAYFFEYGSSSVRKPEWDRSFFRLATPDDITDILDTENVAENIKLGKYYVLRKNGVFIGQGFFGCNVLDPSVASIGMSVHPDYRQQGAGRSIIMHLTDICREKGLTPNCGCWYYNHNSKRTLESAGFVSKTRLLNVFFKD